MHYALKKNAAPFLLLFLCFLPLKLISQNTYSVYGKVVDNNNLVVPSAHVIAFSANDSTLIKFAITDTSGFFKIENIDVYPFWVSIDHITYEKWNSGPIEKKESEINLGTIILKENTSQLDEVTVTAQKPFIEMKPDKMVVNINQDDISLGDNAFEVMEKLPTVTVDILSGAINIQGKQGSTVLINGRATHLSSGDLATFLRNTPSNEIKAVEIITNPSAKYDASGNAGIINILMEKNEEEGLNGSLWENVRYTKYFQNGGGANVNFRKGKWNLYGSYSYNDIKAFTNIEYKQTYLGAETPLKSKQNSNRIFNIYPHNFNMGIDYTTETDFSINFLFKGSTVKTDSPQNIAMMFSDLNTGAFVSRTHTESSVNEHNQNYAFNLNLSKQDKEHNIDYSFDANYTFYDRLQDQYFRTVFYDDTNNDTGERNVLSSEIPSLIDIWALKGDVSKTFASKIKMETGIKWSRVVNDNHPKYFDIENGNQTPNTDLTNHFVYDENILAGYIDFSKEFERSTIKIGLRAENTVGNGDQKITDETFKREYLEFFPSLFYSIEVSEHHNLSFAVGRRIDRPSYSDLNPYRLFLDQYSSWQGNPLLKPQFSYNYEISHQYKKLNTKLSYTHTNDVIGSLVFQDDNTQVSTETRDNLNTFSQLNLSVSSAFKPWNWWRSNMSASVFNNHYKGSYLNEAFSLKGVGFIFSNNNSFKISPQINGSLSFNYNSPYLNGIEKSRSNYALNVGISRTSKDKRTVLSLRANDVFWGRRGGGTTEIANLNRTSLVKYGSRSIGLYFTYKFGKSTVPSAKRRKTGDEEEKSRI